MTYNHSALGERSENLDRLNAQINRFRMMDNHASGCNSLQAQPKQEGFQYDVYIVMHCDCLISLKNPTFSEKVAFVRHMATRFGGVHTQQCNTSNPIQSSNSTEAKRSGWSATARVGCHKLTSQSNPRILNP